VKGRPLFIVAETVGDLPAARNDASTIAKGTGQ